MQDLEADYVIIGAGAVAMAFADTLLSESDATSIMVDRRHKPGGHWNDAYPYVRLHQPSLNYGVNSRELGTGAIDPTGLNAGMFELATGSEIVTYFDEVMRHQFLPTGRMTYLPMHDYRDGLATSLVGGAATRLKARKKVVDVTFAEMQIPSRTPPNFQVADGVRLIAPNDLTRLAAAAERFVIIGAGKTAIDAVTWLLSNGADPAAITWVRARDPWLFSRETIQPDYAFFEPTFGALAASFEAAAQSRSVDDIFLELEARGCMYRIDQAVTPTMYRCAIVSERELEQIRRVTDVVRMGHVKAIEPGKIRLEHGEIDMPAGAVIVNCSACGIPRKTPQPIFQPGKIVPQYVRTCAPTFSAALVAKVEVTLQDDAEKNALCAPTPIPNAPFDWMTMQLTMMANTAAWQRQAWLMDWVRGSRLDRYNLMAARAVSQTDADTLPTLARYQAAVGPGMARLAELVAAG